MRPQIKTDHSHISAVPDSLFTIPVIRQFLVCLTQIAMDNDMNKKNKNVYHLTLMLSQFSGVYVSSATVINAETRASGSAELCSVWSCCVPCHTVTDTCITDQVWPELSR
jgi:hypothetical protein